MARGGLNWNEKGGSMPDQTGRTAVVTGANSGIGLAVSQELARKGGNVVMAVRDRVKGQKIADRIASESPDATVTVTDLDLSSLSSVRAAADDIADEHKNIDLLVNVAGVMFVPRELTEDGFESHFGTNHLGHFALTGLLLPLLLDTPGSRVVTVTSMAYRIPGTSIRFNDLNGARRYSRAGAYSQSKLANVLFGLALDRRLAAVGATTSSLIAHPGASSTGIMRNTPIWLKPAASAFQIGAMTPERGALPTLRAATDPQVRGGQFFGPTGARHAPKYPARQELGNGVFDEDLQDRLWDVSARMTGVDFPV